MRHGRNDHQPNVQIELTGDIPGTAQDYAREKVLDLLKLSRRPILFIRVRLTHAGHGNNIDVIAQASLDVNGRPVISHSVGRTATEAVDLLQAKLRGQLGRI